MRLAGQNDYTVNTLPLHHNMVIQSYDLLITLSLFDSNQWGRFGYYARKGKGVFHFDGFTLLSLQLFMSLIC